jgi:hypothetical protein
MPYKDPARRKAHNQAWAKANREKRQAINQAWAKANPEKAKDINRAASRAYRAGCRVS